MAAPGYPPGTLMARMPDGMWVATQSPAGIPIEQFVLVSNPQAQGGNLVLRDHLPADWQPGMALVMRAPGEYEAQPFQTENAVGAYQFHDFSTGQGTDNFDTGAPPPAAPPPADTGSGLLPGGTPGTPGGGLPPPAQTGNPPPPTGLLPGGDGPGRPGPIPVNPNWQLTPNTGPVSNNPQQELERLLDNNLIAPPTGIGRPASYGTGDPSGAIQGPANSSPATYQYQYRPEFGMYAPTQLTGGSNPFYNAPNIPPPVSPGPAAGGPPVGGPTPFIPATGGGAVPPGGLGEGGGGGSMPPGLLGGAGGMPPMPPGMTPQQYMAMYGMMPPGGAAPGPGGPPMGLLP